MLLRVLNDKSLIQSSLRYLKIKEKVSFNIASEPHFEWLNFKLVVKQCYQTISLGQKCSEIQKFLCDILSNFQAMFFLVHNLINMYSFEKLWLGYFLRVEYEGA